MPLALEAAGTWEVLRGRVIPTPSTQHPEGRLVESLSPHANVTLLLYSYSY